MKKRILSIVLSICLVLSCIPITVFAANDDATALQNLLNGGGTVTLSKDYTIDTTLNVKNTVTLDLNGHTISMTGNGSVMNVRSDGNLTVKDSRPTATHTDASLPAGGVITREKPSIGGGGGVNVDGSSFTMNDGTIYNCSADTGGGVNVDGSSFTMNGGAIYGCNAKAASGGGVAVYDGSFTMNGGSIYGCSAEYQGDAVWSNRVSNIYANGGTIKGTVVSCGEIQNTAADGGCTRFYDEVENYVTGLGHHGTISGGIYYGGISGGGTVEGTYYTVSFDLNGGSGSIPKQWFVNIDTAQALEPAAPTREGYEFAGWYNGDTKYDFTQNVTEDITLTAKWENPEAPVITGLEDGKTYCDAVEFEVTDNVGVASVKAGNTELTESNGKYTLEKGAGTVNIVATDKAKNETTITVTVNNGHTYGAWQSNGKGTHTRCCTVTGCNGYEDGYCDGGEASYFNKAVCETCHAEYGELLTDTTAPTGEISIGTNKWNSFLNTITFGLFFKDTQSVAITATDDSYTHPGYTDDKAVKVEYLLSDKGLNKTDLAGKKFTEYGSAFNISPDNQYVIYARLTDHAGNVTYISSNGIVLDATVPVISGIENGKVYCEAQTVTVTEEYIESVKVNGTAVTLDANNQFILNPAEGTQTIVVTDKAGNASAEMIVTVNDGHTDNSKDHNCDYCGVTLSKHSGGFSTCSSRAKCDYCGQYYGSLDYNWHRLEHKNAVPATESKTGNKEYWHCLDCGKYFADEKGTNEIKLDDTVTPKLPPEIIKGKGQSIVAGEKKELTFTSNAAFSDFLRVELDGKTLDEKNYTVKEGSTIVTLKADYVETLSAGEHTIGIVSESGTAETTFTINAKAVEDEKEMKSPETGNSFNSALLLALILSCGGVIVVTGAYSKRKKHI